SLSPSSAGCVLGAPGSDSAFELLPPPLSCYYPPFAISLPPPPFFVSGSPAFSAKRLLTEAGGGGGGRWAWRNWGSREHEPQHHFRVSVQEGGRGATHCLAPPPRGCLARSSASVGIRLAPAVHARAPRLSFPVPRPAGPPTPSAPSIPCKRRPSRALAQALAPPPPPPPPQVQEPWKGEGIRRQEEERE
ncbi:hypothetical protein U0070_021757, partial [Myodes glareolus]